MKTYDELRKININEHIEKKNNLSYLSWAWAVDLLFQNDPEASWEYLAFENKPWMDINGTFMVFCKVKAFGRERTAQLPIMDFKNKAITTFDAFDLNTTMQRCLAKAISLHGIGLYIYAGEDLPEGGNPEPGESPGKIVDQELATDGLPTEVVARLREEAVLITKDFYAVGAKAALGSWLSLKKAASLEEQAAAWSFITDSKVRSGIKKAGEATKEGT